VVECKYCGEEFENQRGLSGHKRYHHPNVGEFSCNYCKKSYDRKESLENHLYHKHQQERGEKCPYCQNYFKGNKGLSKHISNKHPQQGKFDCKYCSKAFRKETILHRHLKYNHQEKAFDVECKECGQKFKNKRAKNSHYRIEHTNFSELNDDELLSLLRKIEEKEGKVTQKLINKVDYAPHSSYYSRRFKSISKAKEKADLDDSGTIILTDEEYKKLNNELESSELIQEIITGLLMGDGWIEKEEGKNPSFSIELTNKKFLDWLDRKLGNISRSVRPKRNPDNIVIKNKTVDKAKDCYILSTRNLKGFDRFNSWYSSGEKRFPEIDLTPMILKMWYVCDGSYTNYPVIYSTNENDRKDFILSFFDNLSLNPNFNMGGGGCLQFKKSEVEEFFSYIGKSVPGFEYKWP
jgi:uncharacterized Zn-finger protein